MVTMADVARRAEVSSTTVSHVLNGTRPVADTTRARVLAAVEEMGYVPNHQARSMVRSQTQLIGLAISVLTHHYFADLVHAIQTAAFDSGFTLLLGDTREDPHSQDRVVAALRSRRVDGLLIAPVPDSGPLLDELARHKVPTVLIDRSPDGRFAAVSTENIEPVAQLVTHLATIGHRRIAMISGMTGLTSTDERIEGYRLGLDRAGLALDPSLLTPGESDTQQTYVAMDGLLNRPDPPTAIVAANNTMLIAAVRHLEVRGLRVPEDMAVVGFDDFEWADTFRPRLTTVAQDCLAQGRLAVDLLLERVNGTTGTPRTVRVPATVMHRESCGCGKPGDTLF